MKGTSARKNSGLRLLGLCLVLLGVCVFAWGLRYKLSLYDAPHSIARQMPHAKLLTSRERSQMPVKDLREAASLGAPLLGCTLLLTLFGLIEAPIRNRLAWSPRDIFAGPPPLHATSHACNNRPPPRLL
jgi:hypothetical protein